MKKWLALVAIVVTGTGAFVRWWRGHRRFGAETVNRVVNPWLVRQDVSDMSRGEIGLLEHVGRKTGTVRVTPVHPVRTSDGFRIIVPLGDESQWARNVLAAGHCRMQVGDVVHELDEPSLVDPTGVEGVPALGGRAMAWLGFRYLRLHSFAEHPGTLATVTPQPESTEPGPPARKRARRPKQAEPLPGSIEPVPVA